MKQIRFSLILTMLTLLIPAGLVAQSEDNLAAMVIEEHVREALLEKGGAAAVPIRVLMDGSTAILTGEVTSKPVQELATEVALSVDGVKDVNNRLTLADKKSMSDMSADDAADAAAGELKEARLETKVKIALYKEIGTKARKIEVEASGGVVSLRGTLPDEARKSIALATAKGIDDVQQVVDLIKVQ